MSDWLTVERAAKREAELSRRSLEVRGLVRGQPVAWAEYANARTDGLSLLHRVGDPDESAPETFCGEDIPPAVCRLDLTAWPVSALRSCKYCAKGYLLSLKRGV
jgi:hypothetical protein